MSVMGSPALAAIVGGAAALLQMPDPEGYFWGGLLTALFPVLILGTLGGIAVYLYVKERDRSEGPPQPGEPEARDAEANDRER
jgi:hypothetical protein